MRFEEIPHNVIDDARNGNHEAMEELCLMVQPGAYAVLLSLLRNTEDASDALQDSLIRMVRFLPKLRDTKALPAWLMRLLVNQASVAQKHRSVPIVDISTIETDTSSARLAASSAIPASSLKTAEGNEITALINKALEEIPPRQRAALILFEIEQLSIHEVALTMELTDGAVKFHLHEARKNMRNRLQDIGVPDAVMFQEHLP